MIGEIVNIFVVISSVGNASSCVRLDNWLPPYRSYKPNQGEIITIKPHFTNSNEFSCINQELHISSKCDLITTAKLIFKKNISSWKNLYCSFVHMDTIYNNKGLRKINIALNSWKSEWKRIN